MATTHCAQCKREISLLAKTCPHCGAAVSELGTLASPPRAKPHGPLYEIAYRQKLVLYAVLLDFLAPLSGGFLAQPSEPPVSRVMPGLVEVIWLCGLCSQSGPIINWERLGLPMSVICLGAACLIFPCVSLIVLIGITRIAARKLRRAGMQVGLMGANLREDSQGPLTRMQSRFGQTNVSPGRPRRHRHALGTAGVAAR